MLSVWTGTDGTTATAANVAVTEQAAVMGAVTNVPGVVVAPPQPLKPVRT